MEHLEFANLLAAYFLDALEEQEKKHYWQSEFRHHRPNEDDLASVVRGLLYSAPLVAPAPRVKTKILTAIGEQLKDENES